MDSLFANYASSDEEEEEESLQQHKHQPPNSKPLEKSTETLNRQHENDEDDDDFVSVNNKRSTLSFLPAPKASKADPFNLPTPLASSELKPKRVVQFKPPVISSGMKDDIDDDDDGEDEKEKRRKGSESDMHENHDDDDDFFSGNDNPSILSSLPAPKASKADPFNLPTPLASWEPKPKRVVQFKPPVISSGMQDNGVDDDDEDEIEKQRKRSKSNVQTPKSFLLSMPVPKSSGATLGSLPLGSGTGRRSILEADVPASDSIDSSVGTEASINSNVGYYEGQSVHGSTVSSSGVVDGGCQSEYVDSVGGEGGYPQWGTQSENYANYQGYTGYGNGDGEYSNWVASDGEQYSNYASLYGTYGDYRQFEHNWVDGSNASAQELPESAESALRLTGKRGRNDAPQQIVEVKQDELTKNRPREDQARLTGIAFGPSYKPASTKGKPSKLHKRKHQIGSLYFDMRQKEMELAERRARGMLTKAQTQGKYGW